MQDRLVACLTGDSGQGVSGGRGRGVQLPARRRARGGPARRAAPPRPGAPRSPRGARTASTVGRARRGRRGRTRPELAGCPAGACPRTRGSASARRATRREAAWSRREQSARREQRRRRHRGRAGRGEPRVRGQVRARVPDLRERADAGRDPGGGPRADRQRRARPSARSSPASCARSPCCGWRGCSMPSDDGTAADLARPDLHAHPGHGHRRAGPRRLRAAGAPRLRRLAA